MLQAGKLLVATPAILDPNFARTVVLLCQHGEEGSVGLVLNRPSDIPVAEHLPEWAAIVAVPFVGVGGPVDTEAAIGLGKGTGSPEVWTPICCDLGLVDLSRGPEVEVEKARVFAGYAGWGPGQLEAEIEDAGWFVVDMQEGDAFRSDPNDWSAVLKRQSSDVALFADFPPDPTLN